MRLPMKVGGLGADTPPFLQIGFSLNANQNVEHKTRACARTAALLAKTTVDEHWGINLVYFSQPRRYPSASRTVS